MQSGLPVIVADCHSGPREILAPNSDLKSRITKMELTQYGILCPALPNADIKEDVPAVILNEWMNAFAVMTNEPELKNRFIQKGYGRVMDFDRKAILKQWRECIAAAFPYIQ